MSHIYCRLKLSRRASRSASASPTAAAAAGCLAAAALADRDWPVPGRPVKTNGKAFQKTSTFTSSVLMLTKRYLHTLQPYIIVRHTNKKQKCQCNMASFFCQYNRFLYIAGSSFLLLHNSFLVKHVSFHGEDNSWNSTVDQEQCSCTNTECSLVLMKRTQECVAKTYKK